jgi:hypothetical protein
MRQLLVWMCALVCCAPLSASADDCSRPLDEAFAQKFSDEWITAWNSHDLSMILAHYHDDFEMQSPGIVQRMNESSGTLRGKAKVGAYWRIALDAQPDLTFQKIGVFVGARSIVIHYRNQTGRLGAELLEFDAACRVIRSSANYMR